MTEKDIIEGCRHGDSAAQRELYLRYGAVMFGICCRYVKDRSEAEDLLHDGFITIYTKIAEFRGEGSFEGWCKRIFVNTALSYLRRNNPVADALNIDDASWLEGDGVSAVEQMSAAELMETISSLPEGYRTILNLYAVDGYSHKEIGDMLGISETTSRSQYFRARGKLMDLLTKEGNNRR